MSAKTILEAVYPSPLVDAILIAYSEIEGNYSIKKWKASELDAGHFCEVARRMIEHSLFGRHTPIGAGLPNFNDQEIKKYEQTTGDESFRILMPRVLKSVYNLRNKRGVGHLGNISPNEMDATLILYSVKWVLSEFVRLSACGSLDTTAAQIVVDQLIERRVALIWNNGETKRILIDGISMKDKVLILLYDENLQTEDALREHVEYKNKGNFRRLLNGLHSARLIEFSIGRSIAITPKGVIAAEEIMLALGSTSTTTVKKAKKRKRSPKKG